MEMVDVRRALGQFWAEYAGRTIPYVKVPEVAAEPPLKRHPCLAWKGCVCKGDGREVVSAHDKLNGIVKGAAPKGPEREALEMGHRFVALICCKRVELPAKPGGEGLVVMLKAQQVR